jgi:hypothetical protein
MRVTRGEEGGGAMLQRATILATFLLGLVLVLPVTAATPPSPVTIRTQISFASMPFQGTFAVTEGAAALGCSGGTFVDSPRSMGVIEKHFTCTDGSGADDSFVVLFHPRFRGVPGPGVANGPWSVLSGAGDFTKLHGTGRFSVVVTGPASGTETFKGAVHFD